MMADNDDDDCCAAAVVLVETFSFLAMNVTMFGKSNVRSDHTCCLTTTMTTTKKKKQEGEEDAEDGEEDTDTTTTSSSSSSLPLPLPLLDGCDIRNWRRHQLVETWTYLQGTLNVGVVRPLELIMDLFLHVLETFNQYTYLCSIRPDPLFQESREEADMIKKRNTTLAKKSTP
jgi:hypothetical protein